MEDERDGEVATHYYGHPHRGMEMARDEIIPGILAKEPEALSKDDRRRLLYFVEYHGDPVSLKIKHLRRHLKLGGILD